MQASETNLPFTLRRRQLSILPAFVITVNRTKGQTFENVGIYLPQPVFAHGQLYVAFWKGTDPNNIFVTIKSTTTKGKLLQEEPETYTTNIVYHEILNM